jgi:hypothetical protein
MPLKTHVNTNRAVVPAVGHTHPATNVTRGSGHREVAYRDTKGRTWAAMIIGPGSVSGVRLELHSRRRGGQTHILDNIGPATTVKSTNAYFSRLD